MTCDIAHKKNTTLPVAAIKEGSVIDHIPQGQVMKIVELLRLDKHLNTVTIGMHLPSKRLGYKDLLKIEGRILTETECHNIAIFAPSGTISLIKDYTLAQKTKAALPEKIWKVLVCPNPHCVTRHENLDTCFSVKMHKDKVYLACKHCGKDYLRDEIRDYRT